MSLPSDPLAFALVLTLSVFSTRSPAETPPRYQVYFVSVGSAWYVTPTGKNVHGFSRIPGANRSAKVVSDSLVSGGAEYGILLTSDDSHFVTVADINQALEKVGNQIRSDKPQHPLFFFYFAGHGLSEGIAWNHFSIPGDFVYRGNAGDLEIEGLTDSTLSAGGLVDKLESFHVPFVVLLDNCYDGSEKSFASPVLSGTATQNLKDVAAILRVMNEFRNTYPVLFSTAPGSSVLTVDNPLEPKSLLTIGPLARRFILSVSPSLGHGSPVSLATFLQEMTSPTIDPKTNPAITHSPVPQGAEAPFLTPTRSPHSIDERLGTGHDMQVCCRSTPVLQIPTSPRYHNYTGKLVVTAAPGEYISTGKTLDFSTPSFHITVTQPGPGRIQIRFEHGETEFDASFSTAFGERFTTGKYQAAQRWGMADPGHPALEISGDGRGCGDIAGSFQITDIVYGQDGLISRFIATFSQLCDAAKVAASGEIELVKSQ